MPTPPLAEPIDTITHLQTALDQLATQSYASLRYISEHHPMSDFSPPLSPHTGGGRPSPPSSPPAGSSSSFNNKSYMSVAASLGFPLLPSSSQSQPSTSGPAQGGVLASSSDPSSDPSQGPPASHSQPPPFPTTTMGGEAGDGPEGAEGAEADPDDPRTNDAQTAHQREKEKQDRADLAEANAPKPPLSPSWDPIEPAALETDTVELAGDLVAKEVQIEGLIRLLPRDLGEAEREQEERVRRLMEELAGLERSVKEAQRRKEGLLGVVEGVIVQIGAGAGRGGL
ncbi:RNA polymerase II mediator complex subunit [Thelotrema lepadinum]|nr:RNA polymerase II mediator complex subunit [Thelotrema lepadinum]